MHVGGRGGEIQSELCKIIIRQRQNRQFQPVKKIFKSSKEAVMRKRKVRSAQDTNLATNWKLRGTKRRKEQRAPRQSDIKKHTRERDIIFLQRNGGLYFLSGLPFPCIFDGRLAAR